MWLWKVMWFCIILIVCIVGLILLFILILLRINWSNFLAPNTEEESMRELKRFLGFDFKGEYNVIEHDSRNNHGDRPLRILISLSDVAFEEIMSYMETINFGSDEKESIEKCGIWRTWEGSLVKNFTDSHFLASLKIDCQNKTIAYSSTGL